MNDDKLKTILKNTIDRCDGINFYYIEIDGFVCSVVKTGEKYIIESPNGITIDVDKIHNVKFCSDYCYAIFEDDCGEHCLNVMKDMNGRQIETELA